MVVSPPNFIFPPIDGTVPPALVIDFHLKHNPDHLFAILHDVHDLSQTEITYKQLAHAVYQAANILNPNEVIPRGTNIGILVSTNTIVYIVIFLGAVRAGLVPFPISPRTPVAGIAHLLRVTRTSRCIVGGSTSVELLGTALEETFAHEDLRPPLNFIDLRPFEGLLINAGLNQDSLVNTTKWDHAVSPSVDPGLPEAPVCILHSSGSTGMPKAIVFHFEGVFKNLVNHSMRKPFAAPNIRMGAMALPTFHIMGVVMQVLLPLYTAYTQVLFTSAGVPVLPTSDLTLRAASTVGCDYLICVPAFLEAWAQDQDAVVQLSKLKCVIFGGGSLADAIGNKLVDQGVRLLSFYGSTEVGVVVDLDFGRKDSFDWPYIKFAPHIKAHLDPQHDEHQSAELIYLENDEHKPFIFNSQVNGRFAYRSNDLIVRHPIKPDLFKVVGRLDDQIVLSNGEKCNPGPIEAEILKCPYVRSSVVFGRERNQTGVLIELKENLKERYYESHGRERLVEEILPYVEHANRTSPTYARLTRDVIIIADPTRPFFRTSKATVSRSAVLKSYANEIEDMYRSLDEGALGVDSVKTPQSWNSLKTIETWIRECAAEILDREVNSEDDLFQQGMDSLTATVFLRTLKSAMLATSDASIRNGAKKLSQKTVFEKPTVLQLAMLLIQVCDNTGKSVGPSDETPETISTMVERYNSNWLRSKTIELMEPRYEEKEHVILTGTTGGLGSYLLAQLLRSDRVGKVWALNRKSSEGSEARQRASFKDKLLDVRLLESKKLLLLDVELQEEKLGLSDRFYDEIRSNVTIIIHNAWQVNFNLSLQSFEPNIRGTRNLLDLAFDTASAPRYPRFLFTSSVSVAGFGGRDVPLLEDYIRPGDSVEGNLIGYAQSKLVAEQLLESARQRGLEACILRLGQLSGGSATGVWSTSDWVPAIIASSVSVGCLPVATGAISWLPLGIAARSIVEMSTFSNAILPPVVHISHPRPVLWSDIMVLFSQALARRTTDAPLPIVRFNEWNQRVKKGAGSFNGPESERYKRFPSTKIQSTIDKMVQADEELRASDGAGGAGDEGSGETLWLDTRKAQRLSGVLRSTRELGKPHVNRWIEYWESKGLFIEAGRG